MRAGRNTTRALVVAALFSVALFNLQPLILHAQTQSVMQGYVPPVSGANFTPIGGEGGINASAQNGTIGAGLSSTGAPTLGKRAPQQTDWLQNTLTGIVYAFTVWIGSWAAFIGSYVFGFAAGITLQSQAYSLEFLSQMWELVRDIANMTFLFILIYIAFTVMFRADNHGTMQLLAGVIVVALLVNFSFFFSRVIIDAGNMLAVQFYNSINVPLIEGSRVKDLSAVIMQGTEVQKILSQQSFQDFAGAQTGIGGWFATVGALSAIYITVGVMLFILAAMFLAAGIKLLLRTVVLWLAIIGSPLAFIAAALPQTRGRAKQWLNILVSHSFYPAVFLFLFLIIGKFVAGMGGGSIISEAIRSAQGSQGDLLGVAAVIANVGIRLGFIMLLLFVAMKLSDMVSVAGANLATKATDRYWGALGGAYRWAGNRGAGLAYQRSVGGAGAWAADRLKKSEFGNTGRTGPMLQRFSERASKSSIGGVRSYSDMVKTNKEREKKQNENLYDIETRKVAANAAAKIKENKEKGLNPEEGIDKKDLAKINSWGKREVSSLGENDIKALAHVFTEKQAKLLEDTDKLKDKAKVEAQEAFEAFSKHASFGKAMEQIRELRNIKDELAKVNITLNKVNTHTAKGATINDSSLKEMGAELKNVLAGARVIAHEQKSSHAEKRQAEQNILNLQEAAAALKKLASETEKVGPEVGNRKEQGEFEVKS